MRRVTKFRKSIVVYGAILLFLCYLFFRYGIQLFIDTAFYFSGGRRDQTTTSQPAGSKKSAINIDPMLMDMPHATNEAALIISGRANPDSRVILYLNDEQMDSTTSDIDGKVEFTVTLQQGTNDIYIKSLDGYDKSSNESPEYSVTYLNKPPSLDVSDPSDGKRVYQSELSVVGRTDEEVFVTVNGMTVVVRADGSFSQPVTLKRGENIILVRAVDVAGNETEKSLKVTFVE